MGIAESYEAAKVELEPHVKAMAKIVVEKFVVPAVKDAVAASETKIDDAVLAALLPSIEAAAYAAIEQVKL